MKVILSRKGFDSAYGGFPSPILPDGTLLSLPIPHMGDGITYAQLKTKRGQNFLNIMRGLRNNILLPKKGRLKLRNDIECHLDPDLAPFTYPRSVGWRPIFGQIGHAQTHLENQRIGEGDLFLFFGWFRETEWVDDILRFKTKTPDLHIIYGYLEVQEVIKTHICRNIPEWMKYHPHLKPHRISKKTNALYVAKKHASWNSQLPGGGILSFNKNLVLTADGKSRSIWKLPSFFKHLSITYHTPDSWNNDGTFNSARIGQEFVIEENKEVEKWATSLLTHAIH